MAEIYHPDGWIITEGLQGDDVCDEAIRAAREIAAERGEFMVLEDDDDILAVYPDGKTEGFVWP